ncbi:MAG TPA: aspartate kinase [Jatrophihabitans sp.]|jgi:aspartate kinase|uniref:aspartate kinase n=1 Tax=Jatrophihabitans sp. TaxID=1932789 RepID=UPI002F1ECDD8
MATIVQKYGGSSLADLDAMARVTRRIAATAQAGHQLVVVVSAMGDTTDHLLDLSRQLTSSPDPRENDLLLATGEITSMTLLAISLNAAGIAAQSFTGAQAGIITNEVHGYARILRVRADAVRRALADGKVVLVAGFQGVAERSGEVTTLGRGGSDTTAVALAAALGAEVCEIYTDVEGVYTADPRLVPDAVKLDWLGYDDMLELAAHGCKVLHDRCVEYARNCQVVIHVRSSMSEEPGTWVSARRGGEHDAERSPFSRVISGIAHDASRASLVVHAVADIGPDSVAPLVRTVAEVGVPIENLHASPVNPMTGNFDVTITLEGGDGPRAASALMATQQALNFSSLSYDDKVGSVSVVGRGMRSDPTTTSEFIQALLAADAPAYSITASDKAISVTTSSAALPSVVRALHSTFGMDRTT